MSDGDTLTTLIGVLEEIDRGLVPGVDPWAELTGYRNRVLVGDLFDSDAQILTNTVNTVGAMGKGIAFTESMPGDDRHRVGAFIPARRSDGPCPALDRVAAMQLHSHTAPAVPGR